MNDRLHMDPRFVELTDSQLQTIEDQLSNNVWESGAYVKSRTEEVLRSLSMLECLPYGVVTVTVGAPSVLRQPGALQPVLREGRSTD